MAELPLGARAAGLVGALLVGAVVGAVAERKVVGDRLKSDRRARAELGSLRGVRVPVRATDGTDLHVEVDTPPGFDPLRDPTMVFSHGYALNQDTWHFQREVLRPKARLVFWDQRAHGRSGRGAKGSHHIDQLGYDLRDVILATAPEGPLVLVGHSMGGMTIMSLAAAYPEVFAERVAAVALLGTSSGGLSDVLLGLPVPIARLAHRLVPFVSPQLINRRDLIEASRERASDLSQLLTSRYSFGSRVSPEVAEFTYDMINETPIDVVGEFLPTFDKHDKRAALNAMADLDVLVMVGREDKMTPVDHSYEIIRRVPHAELVILSETGHMLMVERPVEVNRELLELLSRARVSLGLPAELPAVDDPPR